MKSFVEMPNCFIQCPHMLPILTRLDADNDECYTYIPMLHAVIHNTQLSDGGVMYHCWIVPLEKIVPCLAMFQYALRFTQGTQQKKRYTFSRKQSFSFLQFWCVNKVSLSTGKWKKLCTADDFAWFVAWMFTGQLHASVKHHVEPKIVESTMGGSCESSSKKLNWHVMSWLSLALKPLTISEEKRRLFETCAVLENESITAKKCARQIFGNSPCICTVHTPGSTAHGG